MVATSTDPFGYGSSAVVVTSDGLRSGSALLWTIWSSGWNGTAAQLRAYDAVPDSGTFRLRFLAGIGQSAKYTTPGIGAGHVYVGTRDGHVLGFGLTGTPAPRAEGLAFPPALVGAQHTSAVRLTVPQALTVQALGAAGAFTVVASAVALPLAIAAGGVLTVPIAFAPTGEGPSAGTLTVFTDRGTFSLPLTGVGQVPAARLTVTPGVLKFAPAVIGSVVTQTVSLTNGGTRAVALTAMSLPQAPFSVSGLLPRGKTLGPGASIKVVVTFAPTSAPGSWSGSFSVAADKALAAVALEGSGMVGGVLRLSPPAIDLGPSYVGDRLLISFRLSNDGDAPVTVADSSPPASLSFQPQTHLDVGTVISPGGSVLQTVVISAAEVGLSEDTWRISGDDRQGPHVLSLKVNGFARPPPPVDALAASPPASEPGTTPSDGAVAAGLAAHASAAQGCAIAATSAGADDVRLAWLLVGLVLAVRRRRSPARKSRRA
jgi:iron transport multicopper oxidase